MENSAVDDCLYDSIVILVDDDFSTKNDLVVNYIMPYFSIITRCVFLIPVLNYNDSEAIFSDPVSQALYIKVPVPNKVENFKLINKKLLEQRIIKPLFWVCNPDFSSYVFGRISSYVIFDGSKSRVCDWLSAAREGFEGSVQYPILSEIDLLICDNEMSLPQIVGGEYLKDTIFPLDISSNIDDEKRARKFTSLFKKIKERRSRKVIDLNGVNIVVLYDSYSVFTNTVYEHLNSFNLFSAANVYYAHATHDNICPINLDFFEAVVIHYSVRLAYNCLSSSFVKELKEFGGLKILFIQDEYDNTETSRKWMEELGIHAIFTCVPPDYIEDVYPSSRFQFVDKIQTLTGFVPVGIENNNPKPLSQRDVLIGYRGRQLPFRYGDLGREKLTIAVEMKKICVEKGLNVDIEYTEEKRIYGAQWYEFIENCRSTLGTESGANVFDVYGKITEEINQALEINPKLTYEEIHSLYIGTEEGRIKMNQISPRIFEAISHRTGLVLFDGSYSGIIQPSVHFLSLKKDFSNVDEVLEKLQDIDFMEKLVDRAWIDVIQSGKYSYQKFVSDFDDFLFARIKPINKMDLNLQKNKYDKDFFMSSQILENSYSKKIAFITSQPVNHTESFFINIQIRGSSKWSINYYKLTSLFIRIINTVKENFHKFVIITKRSVPSRLYNRLRDFYRLVRTKLR